MIKTKELKLEAYRWLKQWCMWFGWERAYMFFVTLVYAEIKKVYGPQSPWPWAEANDVLYKGKRK